MAGLLTVLLAGCGNEPQPHDPGPVATASKQSIASPQSPAPQSLLEQIVLQAGDLPGWTATPYQDDPNDSQDYAELLRCTGAPNTDGDKVAEANSSDFALDQATVSSNATSFRSQADVDGDVAMVRGAKFAGCYQSLGKQQLSKGLPAGTVIRSVKASVTPNSVGGPANLVATAAAVISVVADGRPLTIYSDVAFISGPKIEAEVDFENVGSRVPAALRNKLVQAVAARSARG